jgi:hypothetical protein
VFERERERGRMCAVVVKEIRENVGMRVRMRIMEYTHRKSNLRYDGNKDIWKSTLFMS